MEGRGGRSRCTETRAGFSLSNKIWSESGEEELEVGLWVSQAVELQLICCSRCQSPCGWVWNPPWPGCSVWQDVAGSGAVQLMWREGFPRLGKCLSTGKGWDLCAGARLKRRRKGTRGVWAVGQWHWRGLSLGGVFWGCFCPTEMLLQPSEGLGMDVPKWILPGSAFSSLWQPSVSPLPR